MKHGEEIVLDDRVHIDRWSPGLEAAAKASVGEDVAEWILQSLSRYKKKTIADLLAEVPVTWTALHLADDREINIAVAEVHAALENDFNTHGSRSANTGRRLYAGRASSFTAQELDEIPGVRAYAAHQTKAVSELGPWWVLGRPAKFKFRGVNQPVYLVPDSYLMGFGPNEVPQFEGLVVARWSALANLESRLFIAERIQLSLEHHVEVDLNQDLDVPTYAGCEVPESVARGTLIAEILKYLVWPAEWPREVAERASAVLGRAHRPWRPRGELDVSIEHLDEVVHALKPHQALPKKPKPKAMQPRASLPIRLPAPRLVKNARAAEEYAAEVMRAWGFRAVKVTPAGADGGVDVRSKEAVVQVKMEGVSTGRPIVQAIFGLAALENNAAVLFSLAGYTAEAVAWAISARVALFEFELDGTITARSPLARELLTSGVSALGLDIEANTN